MQLEEKVGEKKADLGIGFELYDNKGLKIDKKKGIPKPLLENNGGYMVSKEVSLDTIIKPNTPANVPYTLLVSTFEAN